MSKLLLQICFVIFLLVVASCNTDDASKRTSDVSGNLTKDAGVDLNNFSRYDANIKDINFQKGDDSAGLYRIDDAGRVIFNQTDFRCNWDTGTCNHCSNAAEYAYCSKSRAKCCGKDCPSGWQCIHYGIGSKIDAGPPKACPSNKYCSDKMCSCYQSSGACKEFEGCVDQCDTYQECPW